MYCNYKRRTFSSHTYMNCDSLQDITEPLPMVLTYFIKPKSSNVKKSLMWTNNSWIFRRHCTLLSSGTINAYKKQTSKEQTWYPSYFKNTSKNGTVQRFLEFTDFSEELMTSSDLIILEMVVTLLSKRVIPHGSS